MFRKPASQPKSKAKKQQRFIRSEEKHKNRRRSNEPWRDAPGKCPKLAAPLLLDALSIKSIIHKRVAVLQALYYYFAFGEILRLGGSGCRCSVRLVYVRSKAVSTGHGNMEY